MIKIKSAIYCRVSTEGQEKDGTSLKTQMEACLQYCQEKDYEITHKFSEAFSGLSLERPKLNELRELVRSEVIDSVVVYSLDRFSRDPTYGVILTQELEKHHVKLVAVTEDVDGSELGKLISYIRGFASKLESEKIKERTLRGKRASVALGKIPHGGFTRLYGYDYDKNCKKRIINKTEAYWVKKMFDWLVKEGLSTNAITFRLRELNLPAKYSLYWNRSSVSAILKNPAYTGKTFAFTFYQGTNTRKPQKEWLEIPGVTPQVISQELFEAAQVQLKINQHKSKRNTKQQYLLRGHLYCRQCGRAYCGHIDRVIRYYLCPGKNRITAPIKRCINKNWRAEKLEELVWEKVESILENPKLIINQIEKQREGINGTEILETELQEIKRQIKELSREQRQLLQWALKGFPEETIEEENKRINRQRSNMELRQAELVKQIKESHEATLGISKLEDCVKLIQKEITTMDFEMKRLALDLLDIKVWLDGSSIQIGGSIPIDVADVVAKSC